MTFQTTIRIIAAAGAIFSLVFSANIAAQYSAPYGIKQAIANPFCDVPTYRVALEPRRGGINFFPGTRNYYITVDASLALHPAAERAVLAHECGHVAQGHGLSSAFAGQIANNELSADCFAARVLRNRQDAGGLAALRQLVGSCGGLSSGPPGYPTCLQRLQTINRCASGR